MDKNDKLTPRQRLFVQEYLVDLNATQAAIRAGYSKKTANEQVGRLLVHVGIQAEIQKGREKIARKLEVTAEKIVHEYAKLAFSDIRDFVKWNENSVIAIDSENLTPAQSAAVSEISKTDTPSGATIKIKLHDKKGALDSLARHLGMFVDRSEHVVTVLDPDGMQKPDDAGSAGSTPGGDQ
jgi:phage terminase small subunit